jgi:hypothetical protein
MIRNIETSQSAGRNPDFNVFNFKLVFAIATYMSLVIYILCTSLFALYSASTSSLAVGVGVRNVLGGRIGSAPLHPHRIYPSYT